MSGVVDEPVVRLITPGEAIKRLGLQRTELELFKQLITELPSDAVSGRLRPDGFSLNGIPQNQEGPAVELTAYDLDSLRIYLAAAPRQEVDAGETTLRVQIVDLDVEAGLVRLHIHQQLTTLGEQGDPASRTEDRVLLFSQIRFDERRFLETFPGASPNRPARPRERSRSSSSDMTGEQIARWIQSCDATDMRSAWSLFHIAQGTPCPKKADFNAVWRDLHGNRGRGRPKKVP